MRALGNDQQISICTQQSQVLLLEETRLMHGIITSRGPYHLLQAHAYLPSLPGYDSVCCRT